MNNDKAQKQQQYQQSIHENKSEDQTHGIQIYSIHKASL